jgi:hypothetical protein
MPRVVLAYIDVLTEHPDGSRLYRGLVVDFEISAGGSIETLTLRDAKRGRGRGGEFTWVDIPSDRFTVMGSTIHSINMTYIGVDDRPPDRLGRVRYHLRKFARSFLLEEP